MFKSIAKFIPLVNTAGYTFILLLVIVKNYHQAVEKSINFYLAG